MSQISLSRLDYERFGVVTAKTLIRTEADLFEVDRWCALHGVRLLIARISTADISIVQAMERRGYRLMDTLIYFRHELNGVLPSLDQLPSGYDVRFQHSPSPEDMGRVAALSFKGYKGHYQADERLDAALADGLYESWAVRSSEDRRVANQIISIYHGTESVKPDLVAFATLNESGQESEGVLFCVHPDHQGRGLHRLLVRASLVRSKECGYRAFYSSTQLTNTQVQRNWAREGLLPDYSIYTFHLWRS